MRRALPTLSVVVDARAPRAVGYRQLLASREYVGLLAGQAVSLLGDQLAAVALTVLVYARTGSALLSALTYATTFLPAVLAGPLLGGLADRVRPRRLLVAGDLLRAGLFAVMAIPGLPLAVLLVLVLVATAVAAPTTAARQPVMRVVLGDDDAYQRGTGVDEVLQTSGQIVGFVGAGLLLTVVSPTTGLLGDAATFFASAALVRLTLGDHPAPETGEAGEGAPATGPLAGLRRLVRRGDALDGWRAALAPGCRLPLLLTWLGFSSAVAPEALAAPWAASVGAGSAGTGLIFAASPAGAVVGLLLVGRVGPERGSRLLVPLAIATLLPLLACAFEPSLPVALGLLVLSGVAASYNLLARVAFVRSVDPAMRGRAFSIAASGLVAGQGLGIAAAGGLSTVLSPPHVVGLLAAVGLVLVVLVAARSPLPAAQVAVVDLEPFVPAQREPLPESVAVTR